MRKKYVLMAVMGILFLLFLTGCQKPEEPNGSEPTAEDAAAEDQQPESTEIAVTDLLGREVKLAAKAEKVAVIGVGALRLYAYAAPMDKLVGVEKIEQGDQPTPRAYTELNKEILKTLPVIGKGGPKSSPEPELLVEMKPDLIITTFTDDAVEADELQAKTGIPVMAVAYGNDSIFGEEVMKSLDLIGQVMGSREKSDEATAFIRSCKEDLHNRTKDIADDQKVKVYVGGLGSKGAHGIESTQGKYPLLDAINAVNVVDATDRKGSVMIDKEQLIEWNPEYIFIDNSGVEIMMEDYGKNAEFYDSLQAVKDGKIFRQLQYNQLTTNIDTALVDMYFIGKMIYPKEFEDIEIAQKADEIYTALLGAPFYEQITGDFSGFDAIMFK